MKRQILAGLAVAGALTLWVGGSAVANEDPASTLLQRAEGFAAAASDQVSTCAETQIAKFEAKTPPAGVTADAWEQVVETANKTVLNKTETAQAAIAAQFETFAQTVDTADEDGVTLPTEADLLAFQTKVNDLATAACTDISNVQIGTPSTTPADSENDNEQGGDTGDLQGDNKTGDSKTSDHSSD
jgi:hypothetical protein